MKKVFCGIIALAFLSACTQSDDAGANGAAETETAVDSESSNVVAPATVDYAGLLTDPSRPADDAADDAARKPDAVLAFAGVAAGMDVYEMEAGGGYYTELLSRAVGDTGSVVMQNPVSFDAFLGDSVEVRLADSRLANVSLQKMTFGEISEETGSKDFVTWILGPHELWYVPDDGVSLGDPEAVFAIIVDMLKSGGIFLAVDHAAAEGAPSSTGGDTHRIDPAIIRTMAEAAGLEFVASSDVLANADDDHTLGVFDPAIRRMTDRFVMTFKKP